MSLEFSPGDVLSYMEMCIAVGTSLQRGMNYRLSRAGSVFLMSRREGAPYDDKIDGNGEMLVYEGHDCPKSAFNPNPKNVDQPSNTPKGSLTQNGLFWEAAKRYRELGESPEIVSVFEKIRDGIWTYNGLFELLDAKKELAGNRHVFRFYLRICSHQSSADQALPAGLIEDNRIIPSWVKQEVWKRDFGKCRLCGSSANLHFDHIIPYSLGGSSKHPDNIQILCGKHNLQKRNRIE